MHVTFDPRRVRFSALRHAPPASRPHPARRRRLKHAFCLGHIWIWTRL